MRNATFDYMRDHYRALRDSAVNAVPQYETVETSVPKKDVKGKVVLDEDGVPVLVTKRLLKRDIVAAQWVDILKPHEDAAREY